MLEMTAMTTISYSASSPGRWKIRALTFISLLPFHTDDKAMLFGRFRESCSPP